MRNSCRYKSELRGGRGNEASTSDLGIYMGVHGAVSKTVLVGTAGSRTNIGVQYSVPGSGHWTRVSHLHWQCTDPQNKEPGYGKWLHHAVPKCKDRLYINIKYKRRSYFGTEGYILTSILADFIVEKACLAHYCYQGSSRCGFSYRFGAVRCG